MTRVIPIILAAVLSAGATWFYMGGAATGAGHTGGGKITSLNNEKEETSYALGYQYGMGLKKVGADEINLEHLVYGLDQALNDVQNPLMEANEVTAKLRAFFAKIQETMKEEQAKALQENLEKGKAFLDANKGKHGVSVTESGLQYRVLESGTGFPPTTDDTVVVEYTGKLIDGTIFQSTDEIGKPAEFRVGQVIKGWSEALQLMSPGSHYQLYIPAELGYGPRGIPNVIGPNEVLIFDVKLITIKEADAETSESE